MKFNHNVANLSASELARGIRADELMLVYQPIVSADTGLPVCLEALVRWKTPSGNMVMPDEFIPLAEKSHLILELGEWVLRRACIDGLRWPGIRLAVNISSVQLQVPGFPQAVRRILMETGFPPSALELELTEHTAIEDSATAEATMGALRELGVRIALDDFGTGYAGLICLRRLPLDKIKIDRQFIEELSKTGEAGVLVRSMVRLGRELGMIVTAEGVEEQAHQAILKEAGCHELQGYLFSRPVSANDIDALFLAAQSRGGRIAGAA